MRSSPPAALGQKSGGGWYSYGANARSGSPDPEMLVLIDRYRKERGFSPRTIGPDEIIARCIYSVINEGAKELEEGIAIRSSDIDVAAGLWLRRSRVAGRSHAIRRRDRTGDGCQDHRAFYEVPGLLVAALEIAAGSLRAPPANSARTR